MLTGQGVVPPNASQLGGPWAGSTWTGAVQGYPDEMLLEAHLSIPKQQCSWTVEPFIKPSLSAFAAILPAALSPSPATVTWLALTRTTQLALLQRNQSCLAQIGGVCPRLLQNSLDKLILLQIRKFSFKDFKKGFGPVVASVNITKGLF